jgi:hypothetical protein
MPRILARFILAGLPALLILGLAGQAGGPERSIIRTATIQGVNGTVYYSSLEGRYLPVGRAETEEVAGLEAPGTAAAK